MDFSKFFNAKTQNRSPQFELLRLYSTLLVIMRHSHHYAFHVNKKDPDYKALQLIFTLTHVCDGEFIILSGYFGCKTNTKLSRFFSLIMQNTFYAVGIYLFAVFMGWSKFTWEDFWHRFFAMTNNVYWFTAPFLISQVLFKPIYRGLQSLGRNYHRLILAIILYTLHVSTTGFRSNVIAYRSGISIFFVYLFFGCYLRFYEIDPGLPISIAGAVITTGLHYLGITGFFNDYPICRHISEHLRTTDLFSPIAIFESIFVFLVFKNMTLSPTAGKVINFMSECNYGIYTVHFNKDVFDRIMQWLKSITGERMKWLYMIFGSLTIYAGCFAIEFSRLMLFNFFIFNRDYYKSFCNWVDSFFKEKEVTAPNIGENVTVAARQNENDNDEAKLLEKFPEQIQ
jgi:hypothetical protein